MTCSLRACPLGRPRETLTVFYRGDMSTRSQAWITTAAVVFVAGAVWNLSDGTASWSRPLSVIAALAWVGVAVSWWVRHVRARRRANVSTLLKPEPIGPDGRPAGPRP